MYNTTDNRMYNTMDNTTDNTLRGEVTTSQQTRYV